MEDKAASPEEKEDEDFVSEISFTDDMATQAVEE